MKFVQHHGWECLVAAVRPDHNILWFSFTKARARRADPFFRAQQRPPGLPTLPGNSNQPLAIALAECAASARFAGTAGGSFL
jgi:hypothetical protein